MAFNANDKRTIQENKASKDILGPIQKLNTNFVQPKKSYARSGKSEQGDALGPHLPGQTWEEYDKGIKDYYSQVNQNNFRTNLNRIEKKKQGDYLGADLVSRKKEDEPSFFKKYQELGPVLEEEKNRTEPLRPGIFAEDSMMQRFAEDKANAKTQANEILDYINPANLANNLFGDSGMLDLGDQDSWLYQHEENDNSLLAKGQDALRSFMFHQQDSEKPERERFDYDVDTGQIVDRSTALKNQFEDRDTARERRSRGNAGPTLNGPGWGAEDMFTPEEGTYVDSDIDGRVYNGRVYNEAGELDPAHPAADPLADAEYEDIRKHSFSDSIAEDGIKNRRMLYSGIDGLLESANWLRDYISSWRRNAAEANANRKIRLSDGREIDLDDFLDSLPAEYYDRSKSEATTTTVKPESSSPGYSGGHYYIPDNFDLLGTDRENEINWIDIGTFSKDDLGEDGSLIPPSGSLNQDGSVYHTDSGFDIPTMRNGDDIYPLLYSNWDIEAENPEDAGVWRTFEDYTLPNGEKLSYQDMLDIATNKADIYNTNNDDMFGLMATDDVGLMDDKGNFNFVNLINPFKAIPVMTDAMLSTAPFFIPGERQALMYGLPSFAARTGIDPFSYDSKTGTYADPGSLSMDQYIGNFIGTGADTFLEGAVGVAAKPAKGITSGLGKLLRGSEQASKKAAERELKKMNKSIKSRVGKASLEEGAEEEAALVGDQLRRGDWGNTFFADETGEFDEEGKPVYNLNTPISNRFWTGLNQSFNDFGIGALMGGTMSLPTAIRQKAIDKAYLNATGNYLPVTAKATSLDTSDERRKDILDWYNEHLEKAKENE